MGRSAGGSGDASRSHAAAGEVEAAARADAAAAAARHRAVQVQSGDGSSSCRSAGLTAAGPHRDSPAATCGSAAAAASHTAVAVAAQAPQELAVPTAGSAPPSTAELDALIAQYTAGAAASPPGGRGASQDSRMQYPGSLRLASAPSGLQICIAGAAGAPPQAAPPPPPPAGAPPEPMWQDSTLSVIEEAANQQVAFQPHKHPRTECWFLSLQHGLIQVRKSPWSTDVHCESTVACMPPLLHFRHGVAAMRKSQICCLPWCRRLQRILWRQTWTT